MWVRVVVPASAQTQVQRLVRVRALVQRPALARVLAPVSVSVRVQAQRPARARVLALGPA